MTPATLRKRFPVGRRVLITRWFGNEHASAVVIANDGRCVTVRINGTNAHVHISAAARDLRVARLK